MRVRVLLAAAAVLAAAVVIRAEVPPLPIRMTAFAINMTTVSPGNRNTATLDIRINQWSTAAEREQFITTFVEKGQDKLLSLMQKTKSKGRISIPGWTGPDPQNYRLGWDVRYTWHQPLPDGGDRIVIGLDRQMSFLEVRNQPRTYDYPFTFLEIHMPKDGKGEGKMFGATKLLFDKNTKTITLEQYAAGAVLLNEISFQKK